MTTLAPCPGCDRHVRPGDPSCPFCGASTIALVAPPRRPSLRAGRLATVAGVVLIGTACGSSSTAEPEPQAQEPQTSGDQPPPAEEPVAEEPVDDPGSQVEMYGGPPMDLIV
jgi:hypothetical protein